MSDDEEEGGNDDDADEDDVNASLPPDNTAGFTPMATSALLSRRTTSTCTLRSDCSERSRPSCAGRGNIQRRLTES